MKKHFLFSLILGGASLLGASLATDTFDATTKEQRDIIFIADVKEHERQVGACCYALVVALKDNYVPVVCSKTTYDQARLNCCRLSNFNASEWYVYERDRLLLFVPRSYLTRLQVDRVEDLGFDLGGWSPTNIDYFRYTSPSRWDDGSKKACHSFCSLISPKSKSMVSWKMYLVGHGAPDASQVCGFNLEDMHALLAHLKHRVNVSFLVYQTCFGGGPEQLKNVYCPSREFETYNFPIICGCLTDSVSFGFSPKLPVTYKGMFSLLDESVFVERNVQQILKAVNQLNLCLSYFFEKKITNNFLLVKMPGEQHFKPVADNKNIFCASAMPTTVAQSNDDPKCILIDHPVIDQDVIIPFTSNVFIASGISKGMHYVKSMQFAIDFESDDAALAGLTSMFATLAYPNQGKTIYVDEIQSGNRGISCMRVKLEANTNAYGYSTIVRIHFIYQGMLYKVLGNYHFGNSYDFTYTTHADHQIADHYAQFKKEVNAHKSRQHMMPFSDGLESAIFKVS